MRWWPFRKRLGCPSEEASHAAAEAARGVRDIEALTGRAADIVERLAETHRRNHFGDAVARAIRGV
jgi:hypothetical protein